MGKPVFTQRLSMHLNGGSKFSELHYNIFRDGQPTPIKRFKRTDGSPKYRITDDVLSNGQESFDIKLTRGVGMQEWLESHSVPAETESVPGD